MSGKFIGLCAITYQKSRDMSREDSEYSRKVYNLSLKYVFSESFADNLLERHFDSKVREAYNIRRERIKKEHSDARIASLKIDMPFIFLAIWSILWIPLVIRSLRMRVELAADDPRKVLSGKTYFTLYSDTGTVLSPSKGAQIRTSVSTSGEGSNRSVSTSTYTTIKDQFFIRDANGKETSYQVTNLDLALREGHKLSVLRGIREGANSGSDMIYHNHSTGDTYYDPQFEVQLLQPGMGPVFLFSLPLLCIPAILVKFFAFLFIRPGRSRLLKDQLHKRLISQLGNA